MEGDGGQADVIADEVEPGVDASGDRSEAKSSRWRRARRKLQVWRSPNDEARWIRPALLAVAALAGLADGWGISNVPLEHYYGAAVRSMGSNWHDFAFGAVDPDGTVSLDKLPGAFWIQALSVRIFGFHYWAIALPQVIAGVLAVLLLFRAVRRLAGPKAGLVAAIVLAATPATALVNRGNVSDSLLILLLVLAADAATKAVLTGRLRTLVLAGVWVGLAFQTKMVQAWMVLPGLFAAYLVAAPAPLRRRLAHVAAAGLACLIVSLSWMTAISAVPSDHRPFVDGTSDGSVFTQVFIYNGVARLGISAGEDRMEHRGSPFLRATPESAKVAFAYKSDRSPARLVSGPLGRNVGWLLPTAVVAAIGMVIARRKAGRRDPILALTILWGTWLAILAVFFTMGRFVQPYYVAVLVPAVAALCAGGLATAWRARAGSRTPTLVAAILLPIVVVHAALLVPDDAPGGVRGAVLVVVLAAIAEIGLLSSLRRDGADTPRRVRQQGLAWSVAVLAVVLLPAITTGVVVHDEYGSFSTPYQSSETTRHIVAAQQAYQDRGAKVAKAYERYGRRHHIIEVIDSASLASARMMMTGREFLPIGGFGGGNPSPSLERLQDLVRTHRTLFFEIGVEPPSKDPRIVWIRQHCSSVDDFDYGEGKVGVYRCDSRQLFGR